MTNPTTQMDDSALAGNLFKSLEMVSADGEGITRGSYSAAETAAHNILASEAKRHGLSVTVDEARNTWVELPGKNPGAAAIVIGSHLDSVRQGGNFDGAAGVVAGLITLLRLKAEPALERPVRLVAFRGEESTWFGTCYIGSRSLVGTLDPQLLDVVSQDLNITLREAMTNAGVDLTPIEARQALLDPAQIEQFFELHIEQGPTLVAADCALGAVTGIRGNHRYSAIRWHGTAGHSGAVPRELRKDAVLGAAEWVGAVEQLWLDEEATGVDLVMTVGMISTDPLSHGVTRIPDLVRLSLDIRSVDESVLEGVSAKIAELAEGIAKRRDLTVDLGPRVDSAPASISEDIIRGIEAAATAQKQAIMRLPSGAGHDAAAMSEAGIEIGMIFIRNENGSHNPDESMEISDLCAGIKVLGEIVRRSANS